MYSLTVTVVTKLKSTTVQSHCNLYSPSTTR